MSGPLPPRGMRWLLLVLACLGAISLFLLATASANTELFARRYDLLLVLNTALVVLLMLLVGYQLWRLSRKLKAGVFGSRLAVRLVSPAEAFRENFLERLESFAGVSASLFIGGDAFAALGEIGAGIQLGPNAFAAFDALGVGERARAAAVYTERMVMMDAVDETEVGAIPVGTIHHLLPSRLQS